MELNEFDKSVAEAVHSSGYSATFEGILANLGLEETDANVAKVRESLKRLEAAQYINKIDYRIPGMPPTYTMSNRYNIEQSGVYQGPKWGKKLIRE